jgi:hypothetical protein
MIYYCHECGVEIALDSEAFPFCDAALCGEPFDSEDYEPGDEKDYDPLEDHEIGWDDVHDGYDPWGDER